MTKQNTIFKSTDLRHMVLTPHSLSRALGPTRKSSQQIPLATSKENDLLSMKPPQSSRVKRLKKAASNTSCHTLGAKGNAAHYFTNPEPKRIDPPLHPFTRSHSGISKISKEIQDQKDHPLTERSTHLPQRSRQTYQLLKKYSTPSESAAPPSHPDQTKQELHLPAAPQSNHVAFQRNGKQLKKSSSDSFISSDGSVSAQPLRQVYNPIIQACKNVVLDNYEPSKCSVRSHGGIKGYAANTNQGAVRNYNQDRVAIILNIVKPENHPTKVPTWPKCQFFAIYDGHGGHGCADFLRDNLHNYVIKQPCFPEDVKEAIIRGFAQADTQFLENAEEPNGLTIKDRSGSCAIVSLFVDDVVYIANVGDSRGIMSMKGGKEVMSLSTDHKPDMEHQRITTAGGKVYQYESLNTRSQTMVQGPLGNQVILGPPRILPGKLSVSRCFGDIEAKKERYGGNEKVLIADPQIFTVDLKESQNYDFIYLGCDGIFDKLTNVEVTKSIWDNARLLITRPSSLNIHELCGECVDLTLKASVIRRSIDNLTGVFVSLRNFKKHIREYVKRYKLQQKQNRYASEGPKGNTPNRINKTRTVLRAAMDSKPAPRASSNHYEAYKSSGPILRNQKQELPPPPLSPKSRNSGRLTNMQTKTYQELRSEAAHMIAKITRKPRQPQGSRNNLPSSRTSDRKSVGPGESLLTHFKDKSNTLKRHLGQEEQRVALISPKLRTHSMYDTNETLRKSGPLRSLHRTDLRTDQN